MTNIVKYPLELYTKFRLIKCPLPKELIPYSNQNTINEINSSLLIPEIKAYLNSYILKKEINSTDEELYEKLQGLLNKLSNNNFDFISKEIKKLSYTTKKHIYKLAESIILKSIYEITFCDIYAKLCHILSNNIEINITNEKINFQIVLIKLCQDIFEEIMGIKQTKIQYETSYIRSTDYSKLSLAGLMKFIGEIYNNDFINDKILSQCFEIMYNMIIIKNDKDIYFDAINTLIKTIIVKLKKSNIDLYKKFKNSIENLLTADSTNIVINKYNDKDSQCYNFKFVKKINKFKIVEIIEDYNKN